MIVVFDPNSGDIIKAGFFDPEANTTEDQDYIEVSSLEDISNKKVNVISRELEDLPPVVITWDHIRHTRNLKLAATDWAVLPDSPLTESQLTELRTYRQALRDLPINQPDASTVVWPTKPEFI